jgi:DNA integrity scanning protein DisA with diadenylate cyclase activity
MMDGAVILDRQGVMIAYGAMIESTKTFKNFGTRHSAALSASTGDNLVVIVSEEDKKVRILKNGKMIMQMDALQKDVEKSVSGAVDILESVGAGTIGTIGTSPGLVVFGSAYYLGKILTKHLR